MTDLKDRLICLDDWFDGLDNCVESNFFMSIDGIDCPVFEPWLFDRGVFLHKLDGPGLNCKLAACVKTSPIVWIDAAGPFGGVEHDGIISEKAQAPMCLARKLLSVTQDMKIAGRRGHMTSGLKNESQCQGTAWSGEWTVQTI